LHALATAQRLKFVTGPVASGDQLIASRTKKAWLRSKFKAVAVDMSAAAIVQTCFENRVRCRVVRIITDQANESARSDFEASFNRTTRLPDYTLLVKTLMTAGT